MTQNEPTLREQLIREQLIKIIKKFEDESPDAGYGYEADKIADAILALSPRLLPKGKATKMLGGKCNCGFSYRSRTEREIHLPFCPIQRPIAQPSPCPLGESMGQVMPPNKEYEITLDITELKKGEPLSCDDFKPVATEGLTAEGRLKLAVSAWILWNRKEKSGDAFADLFGSIFREEVIRAWAEREHFAGIPDWGKVPDKDLEEANKYIPYLNQPKIIEILKAHEKQIVNMPAHDEEEEERRQAVRRKTSTELLAFMGGA